MFHYFRKALAFVVGLFTVAAVSPSIATAPRPYHAPDYRIHAFRRWNGSHGSTRTRIAHRMKSRA